MFRFIHAADLHLDSPLRGLERYEGAPADEIRSATRRALVNLVSLACEEQVDFVLLAGDLYDGDRDDYQTVLFFSRQLVRLQQAGIPVFAITGNHDAANRMTKSLRLPENFRMLSHKRAESVELESLNVVIHGRGFARQAETDNLALEYPAARPGWFNIGLLHTSLTGLVGHEPYAPCTVADLCTKGYDYWALGHIHQRTIVHEDPYIVFSGNIQGRHIRETGAKGCLVVTVDETLRGRGRVTIDFRALDVFRWELCEVPIDGLSDPEEIVSQAADSMSELVQRSESRTVAARLIVRGATEAHMRLLAETSRWTAELRAAAYRVAADQLWLEKVSFATRPPAEPMSFDDDGPLAEIHTLLAELRREPAMLDSLAAEFVELDKKLPAEARWGAESAVTSSERLAGQLDEIEQFLLMRLTATEGAS